MKKIYFLLVSILLTLSAPAFSQSVNYALRFDGNGSVDCGTISELDGLTLYSVQFMVNPSEWVENSYIFKRGSGNEEFSLQLGVNGTLIYKFGTVQKTITTTLPVGEWTQITISAFDNGLDVWSNGEKTWLADSNGAAIPASVSQLIIGERFKGRIDEFRFWNTEMPSAEEENLMFRNTVNKYHPKYDNLLFYYKFDQDLCENIVDYKLSHHAVPTNVVREEVTDNDYFKYRVVSGYSSLVRHADRTQIDRDMHLMTNDLIFLDATVSGYTGEISMTYPICQGVLSSATYLSEYEGRSGVIKFNGEGAGMDIGNEALQENGGLPGLGSVTIETWINVAGWTEGAAIFNKSDDNNTFAIKLGDEATKQLVVEISGYTYKFNNALQASGWEHFAITFSNTRLNMAVRLYNENAPSGTLASSLEAGAGAGSTLSFLSTTAEAVIGENFDGYMDEVMLWGSDRGNSRQSDADGTSANLKFPGGGYDAIFLLQYYKFDDPTDAGKNYSSWISKINTIRDIYAGHRGFKIRLGLISSDAVNGNKVWPSYISNESWRQQLASDVEELLPYCDGVDVDFEWLYSGDSRWNTGYGPMVEALRNVIPADKVFSVSLHPVAYYLPTQYINFPDYYTFQIYGPQKTYFYYDNYVSAYNNFISWGYPKDKIGMSYPTTATTGSSVSGYKNIVAANPGLDPSANTANMSGVEYTFNGVDCVKDKMNFILEQNSGTVMYFDMGNDVAVSDELSLIRAANSVIASNVDTIIYKAEVPSSVHPAVMADKQKIVNLTYCDSINRITLTANTGNTLSQITLYSVSGSIVSDRKISGETYTMQTEAYPSGIYVVCVDTEQGTEDFKIIIK